jgi:D-glycero-D-manno-heptose 1,7-bisphosphate phosphatase
MKRLLFVMTLLLLVTSLSRAAEFDGDYELQRRQLAPSFSYPADTHLVKIAFFDADSTLRVAPSGKVSANGPEDVYLLPCVGERLQQVAEAGYLIAIVSNQGGIPRFISLGDSDKALAYTAKLASAAMAEVASTRDVAAGKVHYFDFAELDNEDRKPGIGMAQRLIGKLKAGYEIDLAKSFMVGDSAYKKNVDTRPDGTPGTHFSNSDRLFAHNLFASFENDEVPYRFEEAAVFFGYRKNGIDVFQGDGTDEGSGDVVAEEYLARFGRRACPQPDSRLL